MLYYWLCKPYFVLSALLILCSISIDLQAQTWDEIEILRPNDISRNQYFGTGVILEGNLGVVGSDNAYQVNVIHRDENDQWKIMQSLSQPIIEETLGFGNSISISEEWLAVGATFSYDPCDSCQNRSVGSVFIYQLLNGLWEFRQKVVPPPESNLYEFGEELIISSDLLFIGTPSRNKVHIYKLVGDNWINSQILSPSNPAPIGVGYGTKIKYHNNKLLVGWKGEGLIYFYEQNENDSWLEKQIIEIGFTSFDLFHSTMVTGSAFSYMFSYVDSQWMMSDSIVSENYLNSNRFGTDVALSDQHILISDPLIPLVYVYERDSSDQIIKSYEMYPSDPVRYESDGFGEHIDISGEFAIVGSPRKSLTNLEEKLDRVGAGYIYKVTDVPYALEETQALDNPKIEAFFPQFVDFDSDGDLDFFIREHSFYNQLTYVAKIFENKAGDFMESAYSFANVRENHLVGFGNFNGDELLDLVISRPVFAPQETKISILNNIAGSFEELELDDSYLKKYSTYSLILIDYDNDGDEDWLIEGRDLENIHQITVLKNEGGMHYVSTNFKLPSDYYLKSKNPWVDYNADGLPDLLAVQSNGCEAESFIILLNLGDGQFDEIPFPFSAIDNMVSKSIYSAEWIDYDNDGDDDIITVGHESFCSQEGNIPELIVNDGGLLSRAIPLGEFGYRDRCQLEIGDINNDGLSDFLIYGVKDDTVNSTDVYLNNGLLFDYYPVRDLARASFIGGGLDLGDYDNDGDLDLLLAGEEGFDREKVELYKNNSGQGWTQENTKPTIPTELSMTFIEDQIILSWNTSSDAETVGDNVLQYNIHLTRHDTIILDSYSNEDGSRKLVRGGNSFRNTFYKLFNLKDGQYSWRVQAIDNGYQGSLFSEAQTFSVSNGVPMVLGSPEDVNMVRVYPNPTSSSLTIICRQPGFNVRLIDLSGRTVLNHFFDSWEAELNINYLKVGVYMAHIESNGNIFKTKILKTN
ncbi:MAG: T9SS type A sorting domain-containing protein [Cyclobacteriaceae bacterium]